MHIIEDVEIIDNDARRKACREGQRACPCPPSRGTANSSKAARPTTSGNSTSTSISPSRAPSPSVSTASSASASTCNGDWTFDLERDRLRPRGLEPQLRATPARSRRSCNRPSRSLRPSASSAAQPRRPLQPHRPGAMDDPPHPAIPCPRRRRRHAPAAEPEPPPGRRPDEPGVSPVSRRAGAAQVDADIIRLQIEILDHRLAGKKADKIDDPAAWLVSAIRNPHTRPKGLSHAPSGRPTRKPSRPRNAQRPRIAAASGGSRPRPSRAGRPSMPIGHR